LKKIIPVLSKANSLQKLSIQNNNIGNKGAIQLADKGYPGLKALKSLSVANNKIGPVGADALIRRLRFNKDYSPNLGQINFSNNDTEQGKSLQSQFSNDATNLASMLRVLKQKTPERSNIKVKY
jgi:Ran GTPase-activating protein (RanGAP) involved in mRNA processing and transport